MKKTRKFLITLLLSLCAVFTLFGLGGCASSTGTKVIDGVLYSYISKGRIKYLESLSSFYSTFEEGYYVSGINVNNKSENITIQETVNGKAVKGIWSFGMYQEKWGYYEYTDFNSNGQMRYGWSIGTYYYGLADSDEAYETIKTLTFSKSIKVLFSQLSFPITAINVPEENPYFQSIDGNLYNKDGTILIQYAIGKTE